jgi:hypothetical protein
MSILEKFQELNENDKKDFLDNISDENIKHFIRLVNKHYNKTRNQWYKKKYDEDPEFKIKHKERSKKYYQKRKQLILDAKIEDKNKKI